MSDQEPLDEEIFAEMTPDEVWLSKISNGTPPLNAGLELGWSPMEIRRKMERPEMAELIMYAEMEADGQVITAVHKAAKAGNMTAAQFWLLNRRPDEWKDVKRIVVTDSPAVPAATIAAGRELVDAMFGAAPSIEALQDALEASTSD